MQYPVITVGREVGSGGLMIAQILAERLNIPLYNKELLSLAASESGISKEIFEQADEKESFSFFQRALNLFSGNNDSYICNENLFNIQSETIFNISKKGSCIFVGRCADYVLRDHKNTLKIFFYAPLKQRQDNIAKSFNISQTEALKLIEKSDKKRSLYYNFYTNKVWGHSSSYDISINTSFIGIEKTAELVLKIFKNRFCL